MLKFIKKLFDPTDKRLGEMVEVIVVGSLKFKKLTDDQLRQDPRIPRPLSSGGH